MFQWSPVREDISDWIYWSKRLIQRVLVVTGEERFK